MKRRYTAPDLSDAIRPWRMRLWLKRCVTWALRGLAGGTGIAIVWLFLARFVPWPGVLLWVGLSLLFGPAAGLVYATARRPPMMDAAILADRLTGLSDRLSTAWELRKENLPVACLQRQNAIETIKDYQPAEYIPLWPAIKEFAPLLAGIVLAVLLAALPNPMDKVIQEQREFQARLAQAAEEVSQARLELIKAESIPEAEERSALEQELESLEEALNNAKNSAEALKALSGAEEKLGLLKHQAGRTDAHKKIGAALSRSAATAGLGQALASGDEAALSGAVKALTEQIKEMSPAELQELSAALQQAANAAASEDDTIAGNLRSAARAIASGDPEQGNLALASLQDAAAALLHKAASRGALDQALASLRQARSSVSGVALEQTRQGSGQGQGAGNNGQGPGNGSGRGAGNGTGTGSGGGSGGNGAGDQPGMRQGADTARLTTGGETVFVPGMGPDIPAEVRTGPGGAGVPVALRPYSEVIGEYADQAAEHMERSSVPEGYQDMVRRYFSELEGDLK